MRIMTTFLISIFITVIDHKSFNCATRNMASKSPQQPATNSQKRIQQSQAQVDEVVGIMRVNVEKVLERDQKLSELDNRADALQQGASQFESQAGKLKRKMWWKNMKLMIAMGVIGLILLIIIIYMCFS